MRNQRWKFAHLIRTEKEWVDVVTALLNQGYHWIDGSTSTKTQLWGSLGSDTLIYADPELKEMAKGGSAFAKYEHIPILELETIVHPSLWK